MNGLRFNPPEKPALAPIPARSQPSSRPVRIDSASPAVVSSRSARKQHQPREPVVGNPQIRDLADFAKSTGPEGPGQLPKSVSTSLANNTTTTTTPRRARSAMAHPQARDPIVRGGSSDLINFIRAGPPRGFGGNSGGSHLGSSGRSTQDSNDYDAHEPRAHDLKGAYAGSSIRDGSILSKSTANSGTALLNSRGLVSSDPQSISNLGRSQTSRRAGEEATIPSGKSARRPKDPYALDWDSEEEAADGLAQNEDDGQESLVDFLRNTGPAPASQRPPQPFNLSSNKTASGQAANASKPHGGGLRDRLRRNTSTHSLHGNTPDQSFSTSGRSQASTPMGNGSNPPYLGRPEPWIDNYQSTSGSYTAVVDANVRQGSSKSGEDDRSDGGLSKFFSRKRKVAA